MKLTLPAGLVSTLAGAALAKPVDAKTRIPDKYSGLTIGAAETRLIRTDDGEPQQFVLSTQTSTSTVRRSPAASACGGTLTVGMTPTGI